MNKDKIYWRTDALPGDFPIAMKNEYVNDNYPRFISYGNSYV